MHNLEELTIWMKAMELTEDIYSITKLFPKEEKYGLVTQLRRAAVSIPSNIAEGAGRNSDKSFVYFLSITNGSSYELQTQLIIANRLNLIPNEKLKNILDKLTEIKKMNYSLQKTLKRKKTQI